jgi:hypothetical protein
MPFRTPPINRPKNSRIRRFPRLERLEERTLLSQIATMTSVVASAAWAASTQPVTLTATVSDVPDPDRRVGYVLRRIDCAW